MAVPRDSVADVHRSAPGFALDPSSAQTALAVADPWLRGLFHFGIGYLQLYGDDAGGAERSFRDALELFRSIGERWGPR